MFLVNPLPHRKVVYLYVLMEFYRAELTCFSSNGIYSFKVEKHFGKRIKFWLSAFSLFPTMFSKATFVRVVESPDSVVMVEE